MIEREVTYTVRASHINSGPDRFITHIGGPWGLAAEEDAIRDIRYGFHTYYVLLGGRRVDVKIAKGVIRHYLTTSTDDAPPGELLSLPHPFSPAAPSLADERAETTTLRLVLNDRPAA